jgi:hypothetical protein
MSNYKKNNSYGQSRKNIIIYAHRPFVLSDGSIVIQYYLAKLLYSNGISIKICNTHDNNAENELFNKFITVNEINTNVDFEKTIVIYCEKIFGNPLNAKYVVRWNLNKTGKNDPIGFISTWGENELIYFLSSEIDIIDNNYDVKYLTLFYLNDIFKNYKIERNGTCFFKMTANKHYIQIHDNDSFEINKYHNQNNYASIFNNHENFISYGSFSFLSILALKCGCISIIYPIKGISKRDFFKQTPFYDYLINKNINSLYGIAYGISEDEMNYAKKTLHLFEEQLEDIINWCNKKYVNDFINDIINWSDNTNNIVSYKNFIRKSLIKNPIFENFDIEFYRNYYNDLRDFDDIVLLEHYIKWGNYEGRCCSQKILDELIASTGEPNFDVEFYRTYYGDLTHMHVLNLIEHYNKWGKDEGRVTSQKQLDELIASTGQIYFDINFYRNYLSDAHICKLIDHYNLWGKKEGIVTSQKQLEQLIESTGEPDFDIEFYKIYNNLNHLQGFRLFEHYNKIGKDEGRVTSQKQLDELIASTGQPNFDVNFYRMYYKELNDMHVCKLIEHYNTYGKHEGRVTSQKQLDELIASTGQPHFDFDFYRNYYEDLNNMHFCKLCEHYNKWGKHEGRFTSQKQLSEFYRSYNRHLTSLYTSGRNENEVISQKFLNELIDSSECPEFDVNFYRNYYPDLNLFNDVFLFEHYIKWGKNEGRICCFKINNIPVKFYDLYPDFDIQFYELFNKELNLFKYELLTHYHSVGFNANRQFFAYDFVIGEDYNYGSIFSIDTDLIYNHYFYRKIDNIIDLLNYRKKFEKPLFIDNKKTFYLCYSGFDYEYYKNRYFKDNTKITENEILFYYHSTGKYEGHITNNKINIIMYTLPYYLKCGGIIVMHYLVKLINEKYGDKFHAKLFMHNNVRYDNPFSTEFANIRDINDNSIVIYPEIVSGNPLNAKNVVRWILLELGIEMPLDHYNKWSMKDLVYYWETKQNIKNYKQLSCPFLNTTIFKNNNKNTERTKTCFLIKKAPFIHKHIDYIHPTNSICIDDFSLQDINNTFNECKFFYTYDANTAYIIYATICGCIPIIYPIDGINEEDFFKNRIYAFNDTIYNKAIVYGNDINKINYILENNLLENNTEYYEELYNLYEVNTINNFLKDIDLLINKKIELNNTVEGLFYINS